MGSFSRSESGTVEWSCRNKCPVLLPLFFEKAATIPMVRHGMTIMRKATEKLNPGQIPVMAVDQPLFALSKYVRGLGQKHSENRHSSSCWGIFTSRWLCGKWSATYFKEAAGQLRCMMRVSLMRERRSLSCTHLIWPEPDTYTRYRYCH